MNGTKIRSSLLLLLTAFIWGTAFVTQTESMEHMGVLTFCAARNLLGAVVLLPVIFITRGRKKKLPQDGQKPADKRTIITAGLCCGAALCVASLLQQYGLSMTTVGKGGFITALYIIFTPIFGIFIGKKPPKIIIAGALLAAFGMYLLCMSGEKFSLGLGDLLVLLCAAAFAVHILIIDKFSSQVDGVVLSCIQFFVCFAVCTIGAIIFEKPSFSQLTDGAVSILYAGVLSSGVGYTLQIVGQKGLNPTAAALILSLESVIAAVSGVAAYKLGIVSTDQTMTGRQIVGCAVVFAAVILVQLPWEDFAAKIRNNQQK